MTVEPSRSTSETMNVQVLYFPPRNDEELAKAKKQMSHINSSFGISGVGFTAAADRLTNKERDYNQAALVRHARKLGLQMLQHFTMVGQTGNEIAARVAQLKGWGVTQVLALHGWARTATKNSGAEGGAPENTIQHVEQSARSFDKVGTATYIEGHKDYRRVLPADANVDNWFAVDTIKHDGSTIMIGKKEGQRDDMRRVMDPRGKSTAEMESQGWYDITVVDEARVGILTKTIREGIDWDIQKMNAGATFMITNMVYSAEQFLSYRTVAAAQGLTCKIIPEMYIGRSKKEFRKRTLGEGFYAPNSFRRAVEACTDDDAVFKLWVGHMVEQARVLRANGVMDMYVSAPKPETLEAFLVACVAARLIARKRTV